MKIEFPILNISLSNWTVDIVDEIFRDDAFYYSSDNIFFNEFFLNHKFVDCNGNIFLLTDKSDPQGLFQKKSKCFFSETNEEMSYIDVKAYMIAMISDLPSGEIWIDALKKTDTIGELFDGSAWCK